MNKAVVFDLDGTIYFGSKIADFALQTIDELQSNGYNVLFFTNNSTKTRVEILDKLIHMGIRTTVDKIYTSAYASAIFLQRNDLRNIFLVGSRGFKSELTNADINVEDEYSCEAVVIGLDLNFNYEILSRALIALQKSRRIIVANTDKNFPVENGLLRPGANAMLSAILGSIDEEIKLDIVGKPNPFMLEILCKDWGLDKQHIAVVGDRIESDMAMAKNFNCKGILVGNNITLLDVKNKILRS
ncbi:HAD-IIA family hydrolase [uncultured Campylobacter sp.]|uniref:HAD-IIA family hydrolase n=1 Tax=uncultured Campylobacter sp. TaxID=218934 RepID=UPI00260F43FC|nr:HAD-IIA family hydrolase [uncultured Campylobacter sp.]